MLCVPEAREPITNPSVSLKCWTLPYTTTESPDLQVLRRARSAVDVAGEDRDAAVRQPVRHLHVETVGADLLREPVMMPPTPSTTSPLAGAGTAAGLRRLMMVSVSGQQPSGPGG